MRSRPASVLAAVLAVVLLAGCNPTYNWREVAGPDASYRAMFPAKPATFTREIDLDGLRVAMTMTAAEVDGATFAVGTAEAPDAARARTALAAMQVALARNIGAQPAVSATGAAEAGGQAVAAIDARATRDGVPLRVVGRLEARGKRVYQAIVVGPVSAMPAEQVEQFLASFTPR
nr:hypothetical protein [uncultured Massilia sp.]